MLKAMVLRNIKLYFKDKGMFFTSLITPAILLVLYATFLGNVYRDSFTSNLPDGFSLSQKLIDGTVGAQLISSILAVSCVTVPFCSNMLMVQDKITGARKDLTISPVSSAVLSGSYFLGAAVSSLLVCFTALALCLGYVRTIGWFFSGKDILLLSADIVLLVLFGTALSSLIHFFLSTQGQISAVGTLVSAGYGFLCGAYMPMSQFSEGLRNVLMFLPGTYGTSLIRSHYLRGAFAEMSAAGFPDDFIEGIKGSVDCTLSFFGRDVSTGAMYAVLGVSVVLLIAVFVLLSKLKVGKRA